MGRATTPHDARLAIDYSARLDRLRTFFRLIWIIPIAIVVSLLTATGNETVITATGTTVTRTSGVLADVLLPSRPARRP